MPADKAARRAAKLRARRAAFDAESAALLEELPRVELEREGALCDALLELLAAQRAQLQVVTALLAGAEEKEAELRALRESTRRALAQSRQASTRRVEAAVVHASGPRLIEVLSAPDFIAAEVVAELCAMPGSGPDPPAVAGALLRVLDAADLCLPFLKLALARELARGGPPAGGPLREGSVASEMCGAALRLTCAGFVRACFAPLAAQLASGEVDFEVQEAHVEAGASLEANAENLTKAVQWFLDTAREALADAPPLLRALAAHAYSLAPPAQRDAARALVLGLLVRRLLLPALAAPHAWGLLPAEPAPRARRALRHVAAAFEALEETGQPAAGAPLRVELPAAAALGRAVDARRAGLAAAVDALALGGAAGARGAEAWGDSEAEPGEAEDLLALRAAVAAQRAQVAMTLAERGFPRVGDALLAALDGETPPASPPAGAGAGAGAGAEAGKRRRAAASEGPGAGGELWAAPEEEEEEEEERREREEEEEERGGGGHGGRGADRVAAAARGGHGGARGGGGGI